MLVEGLLVNIGMGLERERKGGREGGGGGEGGREREGEREGGREKWKRYIVSQ